MQTKTKEKLDKKSLEFHGDLVEGRRAVRLDGKMFHVLEDYTRAYDGTHDAVGDYEEGFAPARDGSDHFLIDYDNNRAK